MSHKDERIRLMGELLKGMRAVKMLAWEQVFLDKVGSKVHCLALYQCYVLSNEGKIAVGYCC